jgi:hypothetical protein
MKALRIVGIVFGIYIVLGLAIDSAIGYFQPNPEGTVVLRTFDTGGNSKDTVLSLLDDEGQLWVESGHWFRGWHDRVVANREVELVRDGKATPYTAVPLHTDAALDTVLRLMGKGQGAGYYIGRTMLLWAPIKPVRLDPRQGTG